MQNPIHQKNNTLEVSPVRQDAEERNIDEEYAIITCKTLDSSFRVLDVLVPIFYRPGRHFVWGVVLGLVSLTIAPVWWGLIFMFEVEDRVMKMAEID
jgi:hypothetical protein